MAAPRHARDLSTTSLLIAYASELESEIERLQQALRDRDSEIVQERIGDDARAEVRRLRGALMAIAFSDDGAYPSGAFDLRSHAWRALNPKGS
jgi:hypothetical protein